MTRIANTPLKLSCAACHRVYSCMTSLRAHCQRKHHIMIARQKCGRKRQQLVDADAVTRQRHFSRVWFYRNREKRNATRREKRLVERVVSLDEIDDKTLISNIKELRDRIIGTFEFPKTPLYMWILGCVILEVDHNADVNLAPLWFYDKPDLIDYDCSLIRENIEKTLYYPDRPTHVKIDVYNLRVFAHQYALRHSEFSLEFIRLDMESVAQARRCKRTGR